MASRVADGYKNGTRFDVKLVAVEGKHELEEATAAAFTRMRAAAANANETSTEGAAAWTYGPVRLSISEAYRTMARQKELFEERQDPAVRAVKGVAAAPGKSNHQAGKAVDIQVNLGTFNGRGTPREVAAGLQNSIVYRWLYYNAAKFGFVRTVPSEPWHWEFTGSEGVGANAAPVVVPGPPLPVPPSQIRPVSIPAPPPSMGNFGFPAFYAYLFGVDVTDDVISHTPNQNDARAPSTINLSLVNECNKYVWTRADLDAIYEDLPAEDAERLASLARPENELHRESYIENVYKVLDARIDRLAETEWNSAIKTKILKQKIRERLTNIRTPEIDETLGEFFKKASSRVGALRAALQGDAPRYPIEEGESVFHTIDSLVTFERDLNTGHWYWGFCGYGTVFALTEDASGSSVINVTGECTLRTLRTSRLSQAGWVDSATMVKRYEESLQSWWKDTLTQLTLPEILNLLIFGAEHSGVTDLDLLKRQNATAAYNNTFGRPINAGQGENRVLRLGGAGLPELIRIGVNGKTIVPQQRQGGIGSYDYARSRVYYFGEAVNYTERPVPEKAPTQGTKVTPSGAVDSSDPANWLDGRSAEAYAKLRADEREKLAKVVDGFIQKVIIPRLNAATGKKLQQITRNWRDNNTILDVELVSADGDPFFDVFTPKWFTPPDVPVVLFDAFTAMKAELGDRAAAIEHWEPYQNAARPPLVSGPDQWTMLVSIRAAAVDPQAEKDVDNVKAYDEKRAAEAADKSKKAETVWEQRIPVQGKVFIHAIKEAATKTGIPPPIICAIIQQESNWRQYALSSKTKQDAGLPADGKVYTNARGLMQMIATTAASKETGPLITAAEKRQITWLPYDTVNDRNGLIQQKFYDPYKIIEAGAKLLAHLAKFGDSRWMPVRSAYSAEEWPWKLVFAAYHDGAACVHAAVARGGDGIPIPGDASAKGVAKKYAESVWKWAQYYRGETEMRFVPKQTAADAPVEESLVPVMPEATFNSVVSRPSEKIEHLGQYQAVVDHRVYFSDLETRCVPDSDWVPSATSDTGKVGTKAKIRELMGQEGLLDEDGQVREELDPESPEVIEKVIKIIGEHPELFPVDYGRLIILAPGSLGVDTNRNLLLRDLIQGGPPAQTTFATRLKLILDYCQRIEFSFYSSPRGDLLCEMPLYDFDPDDFAPSGEGKTLRAALEKRQTPTDVMPEWSAVPVNVGPDGIDIVTGSGSFASDAERGDSYVELRGPFPERYKFGLDDVLSASIQFNEDRIRTQFRSAWNPVQGYPALSDSDALAQQPGEVTLFHLVPQFGLQLEQASPEGFISNKKAATIYAHLKLNQWNADARSASVPVWPRMGLGPNRTIAVAERGHAEIDPGFMGVLRSDQRALSWGSGYDQTLGLNYLRRWNGQYDDYGNKLYATYGGFAARPLNYKLLFARAERADLGVDANVARTSAPGVPKESVKPYSLEPHAYGEVTYLRFVGDSPNEARAQAESDAYQRGQANVQDAIEKYLKPQFEREALHVSIYLMPYSGALTAKRAERLDLTATMMLSSKEAAATKVEGGTVEEWKGDPEHLEDAIKRGWERSHGRIKGYQRLPNDQFKVYFAPAEVEAEPTLSYGTPELLLMSAERKL